jgi:hypothetical protein
MFSPRWRPEALLGVFHSDRYLEVFVEYAKEALTNLPSRVDTFSCGIHAFTGEIRHRHGHYRVRAAALKSVGWRRQTGLQS